MDLVSISSIQSFFLKEPKPFTKKRDVHWNKVKIILIAGICLVVVGVLAYPSGQAMDVQFNDQVRTSMAANDSSSELTEETVRQIKDSKHIESQVHSSLDHLYAVEPAKSSGSSSGGNINRNSGMILTRGGIDSRNQLPPGTSIKVSLSNDMTVEGETIPILGVISQEVNSETGVAIPQGAKLIGDVSFDEESDRAKVNWRSILLPDGRERPISASGTVSGQIRSKQLLNTVGQTLTKFVGAYAAGSMNTGAFGANVGGNRNGLRNAVAETASERATSMGEDLQKQKRWIEVSKGELILSVLNQPFSFREPGGTN
jgi:hypothetical protein